MKTGKIGKTKRIEELKELGKLKKLGELEKLEELRELGELGGGSLTVNLGSAKSNTKTKTCATYSPIPAIFSLH